MNILHESPLYINTNNLIKRCFDIVFSSFVLLILSPLYLFITLLIKITGRGPVLFVQERVGMQSEIFSIYKFRTMKWNTHKGVTLSISKNDHRITKLGKFLRKYSLDELPQFLNVLKGEMSVVGPRPHRLELEKIFQETGTKYLLRYDIKPGITGWAQVNGWRGPVKTNEHVEQRIEHDLWYIRNWSFFLDIKIILKTIFLKKTRENAF